MEHASKFSYFLVLALDEIMPEYEQPHAFSYQVTTRTRNWQEGIGQHGVLFFFF
jgi:hypothetical protein